MRRDNEIVKM